MTLTSDLVFVPNYLELFEKQKSVNSQNTPGRQNISLNLSFFAFTKKTNYVLEKGRVWRNVFTYPPLMRFFYLLHTVISRDSTFESDSKEGGNKLTGENLVKIVSNRNKKFSVNENLILLDRNKLSFIDIAWFS